MGDKPANPVKLTGAASGAFESLSGTFSVFLRPQAAGQTQRASRGQPRISGDLGGGRGDPARRCVDLRRGGAGCRLARPGTPRGARAARVAEGNETPLAPGGGRRRQDCVSACLIASPRAGAALAGGGCCGQGGKGEPRGARGFAIVL